MSKFKGTPGPWHVANGCQIRSAKDQIAKAWMMRDGEGQANARLIAAAPELLSLLEEARSTLEMWKDVAPAVSLCADIDKAIAKALGEDAP